MKCQNCRKGRPSLWIEGKGFCNEKCYEEYRVKVNNNKITNCEECKKKVKGMRYFNQYTGKHICKECYENSIVEKREPSYFIKKGGNKR